MSFTDQKPFAVTPRHLDLPWGSPFRCAWCGHTFTEGDVARWVFTNRGGEEYRGIQGNPFICEDCDAPHPEIIARLQAMRAQAEEYWWFQSRG